jgi:hypothetical protein
MSLTNGLMNAVIIHHKSILKSSFWALVYILVICLIPAMALNGLYNWAMDYHHNYELANSPPQTSSPAGGGAAGTPTVLASSPASQLQEITVDADALKRNKQYPATFTRDPSKDPAGAYYNMALDFGLGPFPGVYIVPSEWTKMGGRIVWTNEIPTSPFYYTVFTRNGEISSGKYDRIHNIIYTLDKDLKL